MDAIDREFNNRYNEARQCYGDDDLDKCVEKCQELLEDPAILRFHRMKTQVILGGCLDDWHEANECYTKADLLWRIVRRWHPEGEDAGVDEAMEECRAEIDVLKTALKETYHQECDAEQDVEAEVVARDADVKEKEAPQKAAEDDPEALLNADSKVAGVSKD